MMGRLNMVIGQAGERGGGGAGVCLGRAGDYRQEVVEGGEGR